MRESRERRLLPWRRPRPVEPLREAALPEIIKLPQSDRIATMHSSVAVTDITRGLLPRASVREGKDLYIKNAEAPLKILGVTNETTQEKEYVIVGPSLTAHEVNAMMHHAAPSPAFGLNIKDILADWDSIYDSDDQRSMDLLQAHGTMPGWKHFEKEKDKIYGIILRNHSKGPESYSPGNYDEQNPDDMLVPLLRFKKGEKGMEIILDAPDEQLIKTIAKALPDQNIDQEHISSAMGNMLLAAYSPENTKWPERSGYHKEFSPKANFITTTQVMAFAYNRLVDAQNGVAVSSDQDLQQSPLLEALANYADTGILPSVKIHGVTPKEFGKEKSRFPHF